MVFSSPVFLFLFLPVTLLLVWLAGRQRAQNTVLLAASLVFYAWGEGAYVLLMLGTALFNHACGLIIERVRSPKPVLVFAIIANLAVLVWFKYTGSIINGLDAVFAQRGMATHETGQAHLPIGVSFFIFHSLSYVVDVYRRDATAQRNPLTTTLYIALFPQLVAGPIVRYHEIARQFTERIVDAAGFAYGIRRFIIGLAKKVLIADLCARIADPVFALDTATLTPTVAWLGTVAYAVQIYFDFSGYSDMAIGLARMFGFTFPENFRRPYAARSLRGFWQRWHISLTRFFRDYLYIPLGGNRKGAVRTYLNLLVVFLLTGLWHGAGWNFVVWGMMHGAFMLAERTRFGQWLERAPAIIARTYLLFIVLVTWVFFRCTDITTAWRFLHAMCTPGHGDPVHVHAAWYLPNDAALALAIGLFGAVGWYDRARELGRRYLQHMSRPEVNRAARDVIMIGLFSLVLMAVATRAHDPFIYFRF